MPVGLQPEREVQGALGHRLEVVGPVEPGRRVEPAALGHQRAEVLAALHVARSLEHQVLEEVGEPGAPGRLVPRPDADPEVHGDSRDGVVLGDDHPQAVGQRALGDGVRDVSHGATIRDPSDPAAPTSRRTVVASFARRAAPKLGTTVVWKRGGRRGALRQVGLVRFAEPLDRLAREDLLLGDGPLGPAAAEERDGPVQQRCYPGLEPDEVEEVDHQPEHPREEPAEPQPADAGHRREPRDRRHRALVEVVERRLGGLARPAGA